MTATEVVAAWNRIFQRATNNQFAWDSAEEWQKDPPHARHMYWQHLARFHAWYRIYDLCIRLPEVLADAWLMPWEWRSIPDEGVADGVNLYKRVLFTIACRVGWLKFDTVLTCSSLGAKMGATDNSTVLDLALMEEHGDRGKWMLPGLENLAGAWTPADCGCCKAHPEWCPLMVRLPPRCVFVRGVLDRMRFVAERFRCAIHEHVALELCYSSNNSRRLAADLAGIVCDYVCCRGSIDKGPNRASG